MLENLFFIYHLLRIITLVMIFLILFLEIYKKRKMANFCILYIICIELSASIIYDNMWSLITTVIWLFHYLKYNDLLSSEQKEKNL